MEMGLLEMCFSASVIILVVVICRALFINKLPKKVFLVLWAVALSRLLIPYSLPSVSSIYSLAGKSQFIMDKAEGIINGTEEKQENEKNAGNIIIKERNEKKGLSVLGAVWLAGFIISVLVFITAYILLYRRFCTSLPVNNRFAEEWLKSHKTIRRLSIRQSGFIKSPLSYGIFHPVILMPETTDWEDSKKLMYILEHEFIPVSSSGHLEIIMHLFNMEAANFHLFLEFVNIGTLLALLLYFHKRIWKILKDVFMERNYKLAINLVITTIPAGVIGLILSSFIEQNPFFNSLITVCL